jgi:hypothetical protein
MSGRAQWIDPALTPPFLLRFFGFFEAAQLIDHAPRHRPLHDRIIDPMQGTSQIFHDIRH